MTTRAQIGRMARIARQNRALDRRTGEDYAREHETHLAGYLRERAISRANLVASHAECVALFTEPAKIEGMRAVCASRLAEHDAETRNMARKMEEVIRAYRTGTPPA